VTVVEVNGGNSFPFHPSGKSSSNGSLLAKRPLCVTSVAKLLKEGFDLIIKRALLCPAGAGFGHEASPCDGIAASRERRYDYAASGTVKKPGSLRQKSEHTA
jgi:hypothetical protein